LATQGNFNNEIGVPLTLLRLTSTYTAAVIEEGASHPGDIRYLTQCAQPTVAVVTNAAGAHLEGFGSLDVVARTKGELYEALPDKGVAIINADDAYLPLWQSLAGNRKVITFGFSAAADVRGVLDKTEQGQEASKVSHLNMVTPAGECLVLVPLMGRHNAMNALAATAAALAAGITLEVIKRGLESVRPVPGRLQWKSGVNSARIIDDTYNANPASLAVALDVLADCAGDHYLALGDMAELGDEAEDLHEQAGRRARDCGVHRLYTIGKYSRFAAQAFGDQGRHFSAQDQLIDQLRDDMNANVTLLVKGSRSSRMDKVVDALVPQVMGGAG
jgi:UDP-N-acetylmuramoyl-tripeptide--D-alanyl-D-alanine ligase